MLKPLGLGQKNTEKFCYLSCGEYFEGGAVNVCNY